MNITIETRYSIGDTLYRMNGTSIEEYLVKNIIVNRKVYFNDGTPTQLSRIMYEIAPVSYLNDRAIYGPVISMEEGSVTNEFYLDKKEILVAIANQL